MCIRDSSETQGVCQVENIVSLSASRRERKIPYYVLRPVFDKSKVSYIPVENHQVKLRELFTREEAEALQGTEEMKKDEKLRQDVYKRQLKIRASKHLCQPSPPLREIHGSQHAVCLLWRGK